MGRRAKATRSQGPSIREKAYTHIQKSVLDGVLEAGMGVSELVLAKELGSSRTPIREAMNQLASEGLLEISPNGGMIVAQLKREDIIELYELREALEVYAVGKAANIPLRPADRDRLQYTIDVIATLEKELEASGAAELDPEQMKQFIASDLGFHALLMSMTQNSRIQKVLNETRLLMRIFAIQREGHGRDELQSIRQYHQRVLDAVANQDAAQAMDALAAHIQTSQRERLNEYDHWRRESVFLQNMTSIFTSARMRPGL